MTKVEKYKIIWLFCHDYHSGQWSRGYKLLCLAGRRCADLNTDFINFSARELENTDLYKHLVANYANKI